jgi:hypothetical protein
MKERGVDERIARVRDLLRVAAETHHTVYRITDGADDDWATWYSDWLVNLSELGDLLGTRPVRSELTYLLVGLAKEYGSERREEPWPEYYARGIVDHFAESGPSSSSGRTG